MPRSSPDMYLCHCILNIDVCLPRKTIACVIVMIYYWLVYCIVLNKHPNWGRSYRFLKLFVKLHYFFNNINTMHAKVLTHELGLNRKRCGGRESGMIAWGSVTLWNAWNATLQVNLQKIQGWSTPDLAQTVKWEGDGTNHASKDSGGGGCKNFLFV